MKMKGRRWLWLLAVLVVPVGYAGVAITGSLEPPASPRSTMKTLNQIPPTWSLKLGEERFELVLDNAAVLDKETGLVWEKSPDTTRSNWSEAISYAYIKNVGGRKGWRLPTVEELASLVDTTQSDPSLPSGHPFTNVPSAYWSSTTDVHGSSLAWAVGFYDGYVGTDGKSTNYSVWCVRGGHGHDAP